MLTNRIKHSRTYRFTTNYLTVALTFFFYYNQIQSNVKIQLTWICMISSRISSGPDCSPVGQFKLGDFIIRACYIF